MNTAFVLCFFFLFWQSAIKLRAAATNRHSSCNKICSKTPMAIPIVRNICDKHDWILKGTHDRYSSTAEAPVRASRLCCSVHVKNLPPPYFLGFNAKAGTFDVLECRVGVSFHDGPPCSRLRTRPRVQRGGPRLQRNCSELTRL